MWKKKLERMCDIAKHVGNNPQTHKLVFLCIDKCALVCLHKEKEVIIYFLINVWHVRKNQWNKTINGYMYRKETCVVLCFKLSDNTTNYTDGFRDSYIYIYYRFLWIFKDVYMSCALVEKENRKKKNATITAGIFPWDVT